MFEKLKKILNNSYTNILDFKVACIVEMIDGKTFEGVNVENPSFKDGLCAEQVAIGSAIAAGYTKGDFEAIYIMGCKEHFITPCFLCRQLIVEMFDLNKKLITYNVNGEFKEYTLKKLCPFAFSEGDLKND
jgi:cytidine deaminase